MSDKLDHEALFRLSVLGDLVGRKLRRGELRRELQKKAAQTWTKPDGTECTFSARTIEDWLYAHRRDGFAALRRGPRRDRGRCRSIPAELQALILGMKREDPGRTVPLILRELVDAGRMRREQFSVSSVQRLLRRQGLSGPKLELELTTRHRWQAASCGELWQGDCVHGPALFDPHSGRKVRVKIFALIDDRSRLVPYLRADFRETQEAFLTVLLGAVRRRGIPRTVLLDNHGSFTGTRTRLACARIGIRLTHARPYDGAGKGKIERWFRFLRARVLGRLDLSRVKTLDDLNLRLSTWVEGEYNHRPHAGLGGRTPLSVWEEDADEIRWIADEDQLADAFTHGVDRKVKKDATCELDGVTYEVPGHLRGRVVTVHQNLMRPELIWIDDGDTQVFLREVDPVANSRRPRTRSQGVPVEPPPRTGLNPVEGFVQRHLHPDTSTEETGDDA